MGERMRGNEKVRISAREMETNEGAEFVAGR